VTTPFVVAVDGPSGSGKSSTARGVAQRLGFDYLDTGAMYRAMTWALLRRGIDLHDSDAVAAEAKSVQLRSGTDSKHPTIEAEGEDVSIAIRSSEVTNNVSIVAAVPAVRSRVVRLQQDAIANAGTGIVVEGRDIGTTVAPEAPVKVYLVADAEARAQRRAAESGGEHAVTQAELARRDQLDSSRTASPLAKSLEAVEIDGTAMTLDEVIDSVVELVEGVRTR
jgi:cytidylate kinase